MSVRSLRSLSPKQIIPLAVVILGAAAALFFGYIQLFGGGRVQGMLNRREVLDGLSIAVMAITAGLYLFLRPQTIRASAPRRGRLGWRWAIPLIVLILLAACFRFYKLEFQSLWRDEVASVARVESATLSEALMLGNWQDAWPSYHIPLYIFVRLAGDSEFAFRFPSTLAGILLIPVLFVLGRRMFSAREGLIAAGIAVAVRTPVWYSQEMRSYAFLMLFAALSGYFWFRLAEDLAYRGKASRFALVGFTASAILTAYAHYFGLVLVAVEGLGTLLLVIHLRRLPLSVVASFAAIGVSYLPWVPLMIADLGKQSFWAGKPSWFGGWLFRLLGFLYRHPLNLIALGLAAIAIAALLWQAFRRRREGPVSGVRAAPSLVVTPGVVLVGWLILPYAIAYWRSLNGTPILVERYLLVSLPPAYLLLARAVTRLPIGRTLTGLAGAGLVAFVILHFVTGMYYVRPTKTQLREAVQTIASQESQRPDAVIIGGYQGGQNELDYYFRKFGSDRTVDIKAGNAWQIDGVRAQLAERAPRYIWFIGQHLFYEKEFADFLDHDFKRIGEARFYHVVVFLYENPSGE